MRLQKVGTGILFVASFLWLCQGVRHIVRERGLSEVCNAEGAFSLPLSTGIFFLFALLFLGYFLLQWWRADSLQVEEWLWLLLFSAGLSNVMERLLFGCVADYIVLGSFPAFNVADIGLTLGALGLLYEHLRPKHIKK